MRRVEQKNGSDESAVITSIEIKENTSSLRGVTADAMFNGSKGMKDTYGLSGDTHMMKNIEWGAVVYLTESKYGRNGTEVAKNSSENFRTAGGDYIANKLQSSTGNEYGIYDLSGGAFEYVVGYIDNGEAEYISSLVDEKEAKYKDIYKVGETDNNESNCQANKGVKGDAVYETSTSGSGSNSWHGDSSNFPHTSIPVFRRGGSYNDTDINAGVFSFYGSAGNINSYYSFRVVFIS